MHNPDMDKDKHSICVFCGSSEGADTRYMQTARTMGALIAANGYALVFGGGGLGLMGATARAVRDGGASVTGILPEVLRRLEPPLEHGEKVFIVPDLYARKQKMDVLADAFVVLPGGFGTMDEFFEVLASAQLGIHRKPIVLVNTNGFYDPLLALIDHLIAQDFARTDGKELYRVAATPRDAMAILTQALAPAAGPSRD